MSSTKYIREEICKKMDYSKPYYARGNTILPIVNDMDHFPYTRFYRGVPNISKPVVIERETGWRIRNDKCYRPTIEYEVKKSPEHCFESSASVTYPCNPAYIKKYNDFNENNTRWNRNCVDRSL